MGCGRSTNKVRSWGSIVSDGSVQMKEDQPTNKYSKQNTPKEIVTTISESQLNTGNKFRSQNSTIYNSGNPTTYHTNSNAQNSKILRHAFDKYDKDKAKSLAEEE